MTKSGAFRSLSDNEYNLLINSVPLVAVLIAGADGQIDLKEKEWANKIVKIRSFANTIDLKPLYQELELNFSSLLESTIQRFPQNTEKRNQLISKELSQLNPILAKLNIQLASQIYDSLLSYAEHIAKASGGFLRMMSVNSDENIYIGLPMLDPIFFDDSDE
ncbi:MAG: hypothetical protein JNK69_12790 [Saprospiraceae bacterium]|nr:hypothetical protein [Candidatus Vicinibacter proximus]MBL7824276.1 hypothetical protein [Saprospiraceae bacterium]MCC6843539.1 hypothetical protein [Saprospiraceae bacterium]HRG31739.1 hypothetical protein [Saprospiraceae bacterium]